MYNFILVYFMHVRNEKCMQVWSENLKGGDHLEDLGIDGKIILEWISEK
jgi:hypothetical protein